MITTENRQLYAEVIVDVKARQVDRSFHYAIPTNLEHEVQVGSRIMVPFGPRKVEGYVIGFASELDTDPKKIRMITEVLDEQPPLTDELIELADWLAYRYLCTKASAVQALLPGGMRAKGKKSIRIAETFRSHVGIDTQGKSSPWDLLSDAERAIIHSIGRKKVDKVRWLREHPNTQEALTSLMQKGWIEEIDLTVRGVRERTIAVVVCPLNDADFQKKMDEIPDRAFKQKEIAHFVRTQPSAVPLRDLLRITKSTHSTIRVLLAKGILRIESQEERRDPYQKFNQLGTEARKSLTDDQAMALSQLVGALETQKAATYLMHGVTGSGKTEVYLQAIAACVENGREAIVLVPEISLTPQMVDRFKRRFGDDVAVLHSRLSTGERYDEWRRIRRGEVTIVVGARSAIFAPFEKIGLIVIDEEHETSYKQDDHPKYHARDVALQRSFYHHAVLVLGSATPSMETRQAVYEGTVSRIVLPQRINRRPLPPVTVMDMRQELKDGNRSMFSKPLHEAITKKLAAKEQIILFLNRRGHSTFILCRGCGYVMRCPHCDVALTYHQSYGLDLLRCHYCGHSTGAVTTCPACSSKHIRHFGTGTQRVEEELKSVFPEARVIRMDVDTTSTKGSHERLLQAFGDGEADILLGTQMIAKGLDFPNVTLVGVITADTMLNLPDFRAAERTFQLLTQVAGRAGRNDAPGEVFIQTYQPEHYSVQFAMNHDYDHFFEREIEIRRALDNPPFWEMTVFTASHRKEPEAAALIGRVEAHLRALSKEIDGVILYESAPAPLARLQGLYRFKHIMKYHNYDQVQSVLNQAYLAGLNWAREVDGALAIDVNAQMVL